MLNALGIGLKQPEGSPLKINVELAQLERADKKEAFLADKFIKKNMTEIEIKDAIAKLEQYKEANDSLTHISKKEGIKEAIETTITALKATKPSATAASSSSQSWISWATTALFAADAAPSAAAEPSLRGAGDKSDTEVVRCERTYKVEGAYTQTTYVEDKPRSDSAWNKFWYPDTGNLVLDKKVIGGDHIQEHCFMNKPGNIVVTSLSDGWHSNEGEDKIGNGDFSNPLSKIKSEDFIKSLQEALESQSTNGTKTEDDKHTFKLGECFEDIRSSEQVTVYEHLTPGQIYAATNLANHHAGFLAASNDPCTVSDIHTAPTAIAITGGIILGACMTAAFCATTRGCGSETRTDTPRIVHRNTPSPVSVA